MFNIYIYTYIYYGVYNIYRLFRWPVSHMAQSYHIVPLKMSILYNIRRLTDAHISDINVNSLTFAQHELVRYLQWYYNDD